MNENVTFSSAHARLIKLLYVLVALLPGITERVTLIFDWRMANGAI